MLEFTHNHSTDLELIFQAIDDRIPFVFSRFADGERAAIEGRKTGTDGWFINRNEKLSNLMKEAIQYSHPNYYLGISCPCCDLSSNRFYKKLITLPKEHVSYSTLFANGNTEVAKTLLRDLVNNVDIVGCKNEATIQIDKNMVQPLIDPTETLEKMESGKDIILLAAGPYSCVLCYEYLKRGMKPKTIVDIGSALDGIYGRITRNYHRAGHRNRSIVCRGVI